MTEEQKEKIVYKMPPKMSFIMGILTGLAVAAIVGVFIMFSMVDNDSDETGSTNNDTVAQVNTNSVPSPSPSPKVVDIEVKSDDHVRGDLNAPVAMVEYSDFECPFCSRVEPTIEKVLKEYKGKVKLVYRHFPLSFHEDAQKAAEASECAADQGKFWEMHDIMFDNQSAITLSDLKKYASDLGLNTATFNDCLDSGKNAQKVADDFTEGAALGVQGTPATFINGTMISGAQPYASFAAAIDAALAK